MASEMDGRCLIQGGTCPNIGAYMLTEHEVRICGSRHTMIYTPQKRMKTVKLIHSLVVQIRMDMDMLEVLMFIWEQCMHASIIDARDCQQTCIPHDFETIMVAAVTFTIDLRGSEHTNRISTDDIIMAMGRKPSAERMAVMRKNIARFRLRMQLGEHGQLHGHIHSNTPYDMLDLSYLEYPTEYAIACNCARVLSVTAMYTLWWSQSMPTFCEITQEIASILWFTLRQGSLSELSKTILKHMETLVQDQDVLMKEILMVYPVSKQILRKWFNKSTH